MNIAGKPPSPTPEVVGPEQRYESRMFARSDFRYLSGLNAENLC